MRLVVAALALQPLAAGDGVPGGQKQKGKPGTPPPFATFSVLPSLGSNSVAHAVDEAGTVIVGQAFDRGGLLHAVKWTLQNGSWVMTEMPWPADAVSASARGVDNQGVAAGNDFPVSTSRPLLWPAGGGPTILGCPSNLGRADVHGISAAGRSSSVALAARRCGAQALAESTCPRLWRTARQEPTLSTATAQSSAEAQH